MLVRGLGGQGAAVGGEDYREVQSPESRRGTDFTASYYTVRRFSGNHRDHLIGEAALLRPIPSRRHVEVSLARRHRLVHETGPKNGRSYQPVGSAGKRRAVQVIGDSRGRGLPFQAD